ncbi:hypothetical protein DW651_19640 [Subdoligranulum sp. AM23-21AC]|nr:hypothetical protein DW194_19790 [Subdoligranulum sp. AM16-9]RGD16403.1 hypothetical protein DW651_19640 [Subdoligranulum sp. AM23-21AC]
MKTGNSHAHNTVKAPNQSDPQYTQNHFHGDFPIIQAADFRQMDSDIKYKPQRWHVVEWNICKEVGKKQKTDKRQIESCASVSAF